MGKKGVHLHSQAHELIHNIHEYPLDSSCANVFAFTENQRSTLLQLASLYIVSLLTPTMDPPQVYFLPSHIWHHCVLYFLDSSPSLTHIYFQYATFGTTACRISLLPGPNIHPLLPSKSHLATMQAMFPCFLPLLSHTSTSFKIGVHVKCATFKRQF
jgi:hypothetical protein